MQKRKLKTSDIENINLLKRTSFVKEIISFEN